MVGTAVLRIVVSSDSMKNATAISQGRSRRLDSPSTAGAEADAGPSMGLAVPTLAVAVRGGEGISLAVQPNLLDAAERQSGTSKQRVEVREHFGGVPLLVADDFAGDFAVAIDDVSLGDHDGAVGFADGRAIFLCGGIAVGGVVDRVVEKESFVGSVVFVSGNAKHDRVVGGDVLLEAIESRGFFNAGLAPGAPEIEHDDFAAKVRKMRGFAVKREGEIARFGAGDGSFALAIAG